MSNGQPVGKQLYNTIIKIKVDNHDLKRNFVCSYGVARVRSLLKIAGRVEP